MNRSRTGVVAALGAAALVATLSAPAAFAAPAPAAEQAAPAFRTSTYAPSASSAEDQAANRQFFEAVMKSALKKQAAKPGIQVVTVTYNTSRAPSFRGQISQSTQIWNSSVSNVKLQETSAGGDFQYREGNDSRGSYASTDGRGHGYIFLDYRQNQQYNSTRVTAHETGHVLGLPDHYSGPCSELMSGGGPGTSCTNAYPNAQERQRVNSIWARGIAVLKDEGALTKVR
ncbi:snapalysin [Streptomyces kanamyceticus]|uniref:Extracellular small neutral protease n=1 Tax=Streptomyces kanamyceticus TaxID=1967 RepID=A0A5J6GF32_STRKN|nr:snapalysin [Streptomyces kanamyceticus]QEU93723.1 snapalysin [Streptomyces kanamyceticus]